METYDKVRKLFNANVVLKFLESNPKEELRAQQVAKLIGTRNRVARALLSSMTRKGVLTRTARGVYVAAGKAPTAGQAAPERRQVVMPEELVKALFETLLHNYALSVRQDREAVVATLTAPGGGNGSVMAHNRTPELATMDVIGKWLRTHA